MDKKKICFIAQFPPPIHGLSKAVDTLYKSKLAKEYDFEKVNIENNKKYLKNLISIGRSRADLFYFTISQSKGGNLRDLLILKLLDIQKKKCLIHLHGGYYRTLVDNMNKWQKKANYKAVSKLEGAIVLGPSFKWIFSGMLSNEKIFIVPNCIDDQYLMSDIDFDQKLDTLDQRKVKHILYLSNFIRTKGYVEVLEMAKIERTQVLNGRERRFHFDFAGEFFEDVEKNFFNKFIEINKLQNYVTYHGIVEGKQKQNLLLKCDIFMLLTRYFNEGQPISILEAMGNGMFIVTTNHAGIPDVVKDSVNGVVLNKKDIDVEECYQILLGKSNDEMKETIRKNREIIKRNYSQNSYTSNMEKVFKILLKQKLK